MRNLLDIWETGAAAVLLHPQRSIATVFCLIAVLVPFLSGMGLSAGLQRGSEQSIRYGSDLYISGERFGRPTPLPLSVQSQLAQLDGVTRVTPRIVGPVQLGRDRRSAVVVGMPADSVPREFKWVEGRLFRAGGALEVVLGSRLAEELGLRPGDRIPPFFRSSKGDRVARVVGVFQSGVAYWESRVMFTSLENAAEIFDQSGVVTDLLVDCRPGYREALRKTILQDLEVKDPQGARVPLRVVTRDDLLAQILQGLLQRDGIFNLHFVIVFAVGIVAVLSTSGFGLAERRREVAVLKAIGWQTDQLLLRSLVESLILSVLGAAMAVLIAYIWLNWFNGFWIAGVFLNGVGSGWRDHAPSALTPWPAALALVISIVIVSSGAFYATWRDAITPPSQALR